MDNIKIPIFIEKSTQMGGNSLRQRIDPAEGWAVRAYQVLHDVYLKGSHGQCLGCY